LYLNILNAVIEITQHKDLEALDSSLIETLAKIVPADKVELNHFYFDKLSKKISRTEQVVYSKKDNQHICTLLEDSEVSLAIRGSVTANFAFLAPLSDKKWHFILPIPVNDKVEACISFTSKKDLNKHRYIIEAFVTIYANHLSIINDSERDELTGLLNRKSFHKKIQRLLNIQKNKHLTDIQEHNRRKVLPETSAWLAIVDIDHFKNVNDTFGHIYGDEVLLLLSQKLRTNFRHSDLPFRFGGEEFVIVLEPIDELSAANVLERFRHEIEQFEFPRVGQITVSIGYIKLGENDFPPHAIGNADRALYYAKDNGRNKVFRYETLIENGLLPPADNESSIELF